MSLGPRFRRIAAGCVVLIGLALFVAGLLPAYIRNLEFQRFLEQTTQQRTNLEKPDDAIRAAVVNKAARLGLPVNASQVQIKRSEGQLRIEVLYVLPVDLWIYSVDLHFRPEAGLL